MGKAFVEPITVTASPIRKNRDLDFPPADNKPRRGSLKQPTRMSPSEGYDDTSHPGFGLADAPREKAGPRGANNPYYQTAKRPPPKDPYRQGHVAAL